MDKSEVDLYIEENIAFLRQENALVCHDCNTVMSDGSASEFVCSRRAFIFHFRPTSAGEVYKGLSGFAYSMVHNV